MMHDYLNLEGIYVSKPTVYRYMKELGIEAIINKKKPLYIKGKAHKIFGNIINRNFNVDEPNKIWCTDFTYLPMSNGKMRYNCTIIDLYNREVIATLNSNHITARLAVDTLKIAMKRRGNFRNVILHSDQGSQYTSKEFIDFCCKNNIKQSMSRAGCPYDNAVIERFYNTFKNEFFNLYSFNDHEVLDKKTYEFIYIKYNYLRPHSYNNGIPPALNKWSA